MFYLLFLAFLATLLLISMSTLVKYWVLGFKSPLRKLHGPPSQSWLYGNTWEIFEKGQTVAWDEWMSTYGKTFWYQGIFNNPMLFTTDPQAVNHILTHLDGFEKPRETKALLDIFGQGLILAEGEKHLKQRRIMTPAFGPTQLKSFTKIFNQKASEVRNIWLSQLNEDNADVIEVDVNFYLGRSALDVIGLAGFGSEFNSLQDKENELSAAFSSLLHSWNMSTAPSSLVIKTILVAFAPILFKLPLPFPGAKRILDAKRTIDRIGNKLISERKSALLREQSHGVKEESDANGKDLLSLLVRANLQDVDCMNDSDIRAQISTFLVAGHETTAVATTWTLFGLCTNLEAQRKLREELLALATDDPTMDELKALPYLDMVVRESLRLHSAVFHTNRIAIKDTVLPMRDGSSINVNEGDRISIPIYAMNTDKEIWGEDASEFKPERWESPPKAASRNPGVWSNLMSFLGGPRACLGYQFALIEIKAVLFTLIRKFEFGLVFPAEDIRWGYRAVVRRPYVKGSEQEGPKLPLYVKIHIPDA